MTVETFSPTTEAKYTFAIGDEAFLHQVLSRLSLPDPKFRKNRISSVYYDTIKRRFLNEKINSDYYKTKVRLRWYDDREPADSNRPVTAYLERKTKIGTRRHKERQAIVVPRDFLREGAEDFVGLMHLLDTIGHEAWMPAEQLFPMIVIRYTRRRFLDPTRTVRLSLDTRIGYTSVNRLFFPTTEPRMLRHGVLEVKSQSGNLPPMLRLFSDCLNARDSFSKYEECWQLHADISYKREFRSSGTA